jgi:two-component system sensor histidine kinase KdpD
MTPALVTELASDDSQGNVLRAIAHEMRQPLSAIESIAYYLALVSPHPASSQEDLKHREHLARVQQLVEQSNWILANGLALADTRPAAPEAVDLEELVTQTLSARPTSDLHVRCELPDELPLVHLDPGYGRSLIENILGLVRQFATEAHPAFLRITAPQKGVEIAVWTTAPGYRSSSALPPGSSLSIESAQRISKMHGGSFTCWVDPVSGIRMRVVLP